MNKLKKEEATILAPFNLEYDYSKAMAIREINRYAIDNDSLLKLTKAILDGDWEVEEPMTLDEFKEEYKLLKSEYNRLRVVGNLSATRIHQEAVTNLVEEFLEEVE
ncbi:hypothetical protein [Streptococcus parauberis]|nr:hypothetical protein [Streptococcus parauberis]